MREVEPLKRLLLIPILIAATFSLTLSQTPGVETKTRGNLLTGTWKARQPDPNQPFQSLTLRFELSKDVVLLTYKSVNREKKREAGTKKLYPDGKEHPNAAAPSSVEVARWVSPDTFEVIAKKNGKVVGEARYSISKDGKTLTAKLRGTDPRGSQFQQIIVLDRN
jgi:hypothetical protein